jgi:hypothetical protein
MHNIVFTVIKVPILRCRRAHASWPLAGAAYDDQLDRNHGKSSIFHENQWLVKPEESLAAAVTAG